MPLLGFDTRLPTIGSRINYASNLGTVRYVGQVDGTKGIWLGIEWDDPQRGKHNGSNDGKHYFSCMYYHIDQVLQWSSLILSPSASRIQHPSFVQVRQSFSGTRF